MPTNPRVQWRWRRDALPTLRRDLRVWVNIKKKEMVATVHAHTEVAFRTSQTLVPVDTGDLKRSGHTRYSEKGFRGSIVYDADHAAFVEFGTGRRGSSSKHPPLPGAYKHGQVVGQRSQSYIFKAMEIWRESFFRSIQQNLKKRTK